jgi:hypothetical protein
MVAQIRWSPLPWLHVIKTSEELIFPGPEMSYPGRRRKFHERGFIWSHRNGWQPHSE